MTSKIVQFEIEQGRITLLYQDGSLWRGEINICGREAETWDWKQIHGPLCEIGLQPEEDSQISFWDQMQ
jgi:hypothetical protein